MLHSKKPNRYARAHQLPHPRALITTHTCFVNFKCARYNDLPSVLALSTSPIRSAVFWITMLQVPNAFWALSDHVFAYDVERGSEPVFSPPGPRSVRENEHSQRPPCEDFVRERCQMGTMLLWRHQYLRWRLLTPLGLPKGSISGWRRRRECPSSRPLVRHRSAIRPGDD